MDENDSFLKLFTTQAVIIEKLENISRLFSSNDQEHSRMQVKTDALEARIKALEDEKGKTAIKAWLWVAALVVTNVIGWIISNVKLPVAGS